MTDQNLAVHAGDRFGRRPHIIAWGVVLTSFVCFCALGAAAAAGLYWFVFDSPVPLTVQLVVSQGNVIIQPLNSQQIGIYTNRSIDPLTTLIVNDNTQGVLEFLDSYSDEIVATATLTSGSQLRLAAASRPRFELSRHQYVINLDEFTGQMIVSAMPGQRGFSMNINADAGTATLTNDGQYTIYTDQSDQLHLFNQGGDAQIALPFAPPQPVFANKISTIGANNTISPNETPPQILLVSGLFEGQSVPAGNNPFPPGWGCVASAQPQGGATRSATFENGAVHFWRVGDPGQDVGPGLAGCAIYPNGLNNSLDVSAYQTVRLHVRFRLEAHDALTHNLPVQDVPLCGVQGTECPVMLEIIASSTPDDTDGSEIWHHGFYAVPDPSNPPSYPQTCDTCRVAHDHINPDVWYFYDSGDLRQQFAKDANGVPLPLYINKLSIYASGHQYDVAIGEVTLLGSNP